MYRREETTASIFAQRISPHSMTRRKTLGRLGGTFPAAPSTLQSASPEKRQEGVSGGTSNHRRHKRGRRRKQQGKYTNRSYGTYLFTHSYSNKKKYGLAAGLRAEWHGGSIGGGVVT